jgi:hypothetical protein
MQLVAPGRHERGPGITLLSIVSFCPETAIFHNLSVNLQAYLCGEQMFASAQALDLPDLAENISFPDQKLHKFSL